MPRNEGMLRVCPSSSGSGFDINPHFRLFGGLESRGKTPVLLRNYPNGGFVAPAVLLILLLVGNSEVS